MTSRRKLTQLASEALREAKAWNDRNAVGTRVSLANQATETTGRAFELYGTAYVPIASQKDAALLGEISPLEESHGD